MQLLYEASITLIPKPDKDITGIENNTKSFVITDAKINIRSVSWIQYIKKIIPHDQVGFIPGMQDWFNIWKINQFHKLKGNNYVIISIFIEFVKIQQVFDKNSQQIRNRKELPQPDNGYFWKTDS